MISKNAVAITILLCGALGLDISDNMVLEFFAAVAQVLSFVTLVYHQIIERRETFGFFFKKW